MPLSACLRSGVTSSSSSSKYSVLNSSAHGGQQNKPPRAFCSYGGWWGGGVWGAACGVGVGVCVGVTRAVKWRPSATRGRCCLSCRPRSARPPVADRRRPQPRSRGRSRRAEERSCLPARCPPRPAEGERRLAAWRGRERGVLRAPAPGAAAGAGAAWRCHNGLHTHTEAHARRFLL